MKNLILGIDIGTQFCSVGCAVQVDNTSQYTYKQVEFTNGSKKTDRIPTEICYIRNRNADQNSNGSYQEKCGNDALSVPSVGYLKYAMPFGSSIKTELRRGSESIRFVATDNGNQQTHFFESSKVMADFLMHLKTKTDSALTELYGEYHIVGIRVAIPDTTKEVADSKAFAYGTGLKDAISKVFEINESKNVECFMESQVTADLVKKIALNKQVKNGVVCLIDVGAGTTDFSCMYWDPIENKYNAKWMKSIDDLGGKSFFDRALQDPNFNGTPTEQRRRTCIVANSDPYAMIGYKEYINSNGKSGRALPPNVDFQSARASLSTAFNRGVSNSLKDTAKEYIIKALGENTNEYQVLIVLTGGSSEMWLIRTALSQMATEIKQYYENTDGRIIEINTNTIANYAKGTLYDGLNNSSFLSRAAACMNLVMCQENKTSTPYNPFAYATRYKSEDENGKGVFGYKVIATRGNVSEKEQYFLTSEARAVSPDGEKYVPFNLSGMLYRLEFHSNKKVEEGTFIPEKKESEYIKEKQEVKEFIGPHGNIVPKGEPSENNKYCIGVVVDNKEGLGNNIQFYVYDKNRECHYDEERQKLLSYDVISYFVANEKK